MNVSGGHGQRQTLREQFGRSSEAWVTATEPIIRFQLDAEEDGVIAFPYFSLLNARLLSAKEAAIFEFQAGNIVAQGPGVKALFEAFCANRATAIRADQKDITSVTLI